MIPSICNIKIEGYWREKHKDAIPAHSGIYFVYEVRYDQEKDIIAFVKLLYIKESENVNGDIVGTNEIYTHWRESINENNELCFSTGYVEGTNRKRIEAAYIFKHKPSLNKEYVNSFPFDQTTIISTGKTALLDTNFTLQRV